MPKLKLVPLQTPQHEPDATCLPVASSVTVKSEKLPGPPENPVPAGNVTEIELLTAGDMAPVAEVVKPIVYPLNPPAAAVGPLITAVTFDTEDPPSRTRARWRGSNMRSNWSNAKGE